MADDIDIEEHDVLDNPKIKDIFPDLSRIKTEAPDLEEEDQQTTYDYYTEEDITQHSAEYAETEEVEYPQQQNKIILGSKPQQATTLAYGIHIESVRESALIFGRSQQDISENEPYCNVEQGHSSKLILGSKPAEPTEERIPENAIVMLENWGPLLDSSPCYCKECQILFPTRNVLDAHNMASHSFLIALDVNDQSSPGANAPNDSVDNERFCNHCNKTFPNDTSLIKHLYNIVTSDTFPCNSCDRSFKTKHELTVHSQSHSSLQETNEDPETTYYRCHICSIYCRYQALFEAHMTKLHLEKNFDLTKVKFDGKCKFCSRLTTANKHYTAHVKNNHPTMYFKNCSSVNLKKYQCVKCNEVFTNYNAARAHRAQKHADCKNLVLFKEIVFRPNGTQQNVAVKKSLQRVQKHVKKPAKTSHLIPKSILFKCDKCQIHFTSCWSAIAHSKTCLKFKGDWKCQVCRRAFKSNDSFVHGHQHQVSERFQVITCHDNLYGKVLHQCPDCSLYFHEKEFKRHCADNCSITKAVRCGYCCASMHPISVDTHYNWHKLFEFRQQDLVLIPYEKIGYNTEELVVKTEKVEEKKVTTESNFKAKIYYCTTCKCCMHNTKYTQMHLEKKCTKIQKYICRTCGLMFSAKGHKTFHQSHDGLQINDIKFIRIQDKKVITPPIPTYPKCNKCNTHFCRKLSIRSCTHNDFKTCKYCKLKFSDLALKVHLPLHEYNKIIPPKKVPKTAMPVLLQKYEMIANTWNILYLCQFCDVICDSYDKMIDHCQKHYNKMESYDVTIKNCQVCDLKFDGSCFNKHRRIHAESRTIKKESFQIFPYDYTTLFSDDWLNLFGSLPKLQIDHITSQSMYSFTRGLKMDIAQQGMQEFALYQCGKCSKYVQPSSTFDHFRLGCSRDDKSFFCSICHLPFASLLAKDEHMVQHKQIKDNPVRIRIVLFNNPADEEFNKTLCSEQMIEIRPTPAKVPRKRKHSEISKGRKTYLFYKCSKCKCCLKLRRSTNTHECSYDKQRKQCKICGIFFSFRYSGKHAKFHENVPNVTRANIKITTFEPTNCDENENDQPENEFVEPETEFVEPETEFVLPETEFDQPETEIVQSETNELFTTIYKCKCGLHFISEKSIVKHSVNCSPYVKASESNCSKCGLLFDTNELVKHTCKHHSSEQHFKYVLKEQNDDDNLTTRKHRIFKCGQCNVHFLTSKNISYHIHIQHKLRNCLTCDECGLIFSFQSLPKHIKMHHTEHKCELKDFVFVVMNGKDGYNVDSSLFFLDQSRFTNVLRYCNHCSKHFINYKSYKAHTYRIRQDPTVIPGKKCTKCGLVFSYNSISRHMYIHHDRLKLTRKDFVILGKEKTAQKAVKTNDNMTEEPVQKNIKTYVNKNKAVATVSKEHNDVNNVSDEEKVLHKCVPCDLHFMRLRTYQLHVNEGHVVKRKGNCSICGLGFTSVSLVKHMDLHHAKLNLKLDDLNILNYCGIDNADKEKRNKNERVNLNVAKIKHLNTAVKSKKSKPKVMLFKCNVCATHFVNKTSLRSHETRNIHDLPRKKCDKCGLCFNIRSLVKHKFMHHKRARYRREDFVIIDIHHNTNDGENVSENVNEQRTAISSRLMFEDSCSSEDNYLDTDSLTASQTIDLTDNNINTHEENASQVSQTEELSICLDDDDESQQNSIYSSRMSTASSVNTKYDNTVFKCDNCSLHFLKENTLDVHKCQQTAKSIKRINCDQCGLLFTVATIARHKLVHHTKQKLNKEDLQVTSFALRGKIFVNNYLYKCEDCDICFHRKYNFIYHMAKGGKHSAKAAKIECDVCGLNFASITIEKHKKMHHDIMNLNVDDYIIVTQTVNEYKTLRGIDIDSVYDTLTSVDDAKLDDTKLDNTKLDDTKLDDTNLDDTKLDDDDQQLNASDIDSASDNKLYKCIKCDVHFLKLKSLARHIDNCKKNIKLILNKVNCQHCGFKFSQHSLKKHCAVHHTKLKLSAEDFTITDINGIDITQTDDNPILDYESVRSTTSKRVSKRKSLPAKVISEEKLDKTIYKCDMCDVHFIKKNSLDKHIVTCDGSMRVGECTVCHLKFSKVSLFKHMNLHHEVLKLKLNDMNIVTNNHDTDNESVISQSTAQTESEEMILNDDSQSTIQSDINTESEDYGSQSNDGEKTIETQKETTSLDEFEVSQSTSLNESEENESIEKNNSKTDIKLYKCAECNVYFMTQATCYKHVQKHVPLDSKEYIECKLCGFQFKIITLHRHIIGHHSKEFKLEKVLVEEYRANTSVTESYYAIDKVQSRLVSTTTETNKDIASIDTDVEIKEDLKSSNENNDKSANDIAKPSENVAFQVVSSCDNLVIDSEKTTPNSDVEILTVDIKMELP